MEDECTEIIDDSRCGHQRSLERGVVVGSKNKGVSDGGLRCRCDKTASRLVQRGRAKRELTPALLPLSPHLRFRTPFLEIFISG